MPLVVRRTDVSAGHCFSPRPAAGWSPDVFVNNQNVVRRTDPYPSHCCGPICHAGAIAKGSSTVFVNNLDITRTGDPHTCGDTAGAHSPDVDAGG